MASIPTNRLYEDHLGDKDEQHVVQLHQLCANCSRLQHESRLMLKMSRGETIRLNAEEAFTWGSAADLKSGYLNDCHLCALLWTRAAGHLFDPDSPIITKKHVKLHLRAVNSDLDLELPQTPSRKKSWWSRVHPPVIGEMGFLILRIPNAAFHEALSNTIVGFGIASTFKNCNLYIYPSSNPDLNAAALKVEPEPISSKHDLKLNLIKSWHGECARNHTKCSTFPRMVAPMDQLPSRLLDLQDGKIKLVCKVDSLPELQYTTLSHPWGPNPAAHPQLVLERLREYMQEVPRVELPERYLDAIRITLTLGIRYIWIDSLCIIQDSTEDWQREALKMATVYGRTACNISYVYPPSDDNGKQHLRDPRVQLPCQLFPPQSGSDHSNGSPRTLVIQERPGFVTQFWSPSLYKTTWPLLSRAWVYQERLLCPRNVYYGPNRLMWECCESTEDEFFGQMPNMPRSKRRLYSVFAGITEGERDDQDPNDNFRKQWHPLVADYRLSDLTYENDRVIAFAGIVRAIQSHTAFTYLAGIWKELAEFDLLWVVSPPTPVADFAKKGLDVAPSWSWFSVPPRPSTSTSVKADTVDFSVSTIMERRAQNTVYRARIISYQHPKASQSPDNLLLDFAGLAITLRTRKIPCTLEWDRAILRLLPRGHYALSRSNHFEPKNGLRYSHDDATLPPGTPLPSGACMILTMFEAWFNTESGNCHYDNPQQSDSGEVDHSTVRRTEFQYAGLVVIPSGREDGAGQGCWQRIGVFVFDDFLQGYQRGLDLPFQMDEDEEDIVLL